MSLRFLPRALALVVIMFSLLPPGRVEAHPLGNFTINHYSRLEFARDDVRVTYVLDFAEIPAFQQMKRLDSDGDGVLSNGEATAYLDAELPVLLEGLELQVAGKVVPLRIQDSSAALLPGQGGLQTLRLEASLLADLPAGWEQGNVSGSYADRNYEDRLGWREIVIRDGPGVVLKNSSAPTSDVSNELRAYPEDSLSSPLDQRKATFTLAAGRGVDASGTAGQAAESVRANNTGGRATDRVASLVSAEVLTPGALLFALLASLLWGAAHALSPGHGKTVVAAYLVGARGTARHAAFLGLTVTATHTAGVFALGVVTLYLSRYILPEVLYPWLNVFSGLLVVLIGLTLFSRRLRGVLRRGDIEHGHHHHHGHVHSHDHGVGTHSHHDHAPAAHETEHHQGHGPDARARGVVHTHDGHTHTHMPPGADGSRVTWRSLVALGVSGGLVPCPSALVLLLSAISLDRLELGMVLVVSFSLGLAAVLTGIGLLMVYARRFFERFSFEARMPRFLPVASALTISLAGVLIVIGSLRQAGVV